jgi:hypothetical protein
MQFAFSGELASVRHWLVLMIFSNNVSTAEVSFKWDGKVVMHSVLKRMGKEAAKVMIQHLIGMTGKNHETHQS